MPTYEELIEILVKKNTLPFSKVGIISSLVRLRDTRAIPHFIEALNDENHYVRREAVRAIGQLSSSESTADLLGLLENESDEETRRNTLIALGNIGDETAVETLRQALKDPSYWIRRAAEMGLKKLQQRLEMQKPVAKDLLETSIAEKSLNFAEVTPVENPTAVEEIPSYRELTNSISSETVKQDASTPTSPPISYDQTVPLTKGGGGLSPLQQGPNKWRCTRCGDEVDNYYDICQTCGGRKGEPDREEILAEDADWEEWFEKEFDLNCPKCGEKMLDGYLFTESDDAFIFNYQEENDIVIGRGTQMGFICLNCNLISFPFRGERKQG